MVPTEDIRSSTPGPNPMPDNQTRNARLSKGGRGRATLPYALVALILLGGLALTPIGLAASSLENFEDDTVNELPTEDFYTLTPAGTGDFRVVDTGPVIGTKTFKQSSTTGAVATVWDFEPHLPEWNLCDRTTDTAALPTGGVISFAIHYDDLPPAGQFFLIGVKDGGTTGIGYLLLIDDAGDLESRITGADSNGAIDNNQVDTGIDIAPDTWTNITLDNFACNGNDYGGNPGDPRPDPSYRIRVIEGTPPDSLFTHTTSDRWFVDPATCIQDCDPQALKTNSPDDRELRLDNIQVNDGIAIPPDESIAVTGLVGFDLDPDGGIVVARTESGKNVRIYDAITLGTLGGPLDTDCEASTDDKEDAVMAKASDSGNSAQLVGFLDCDDATGDSDTFTIKQADGTDPTAAQFQDLTGEECPTTFCPAAIDLTDFDEPADSALGQLGQVRDFPIDYSTNNEILGQDNRQLAWAFASQQCANTGSEPYCDGTEPGSVGVAAFTASGVASDRAAMDFVQHHPTTTVNDFCLGLDEGTYYIASAVQGFSTRVWVVDFDESFSDEGDDPFVRSLVPTIDEASMGSFGQSGEGIACGGGQVLAINGATNEIWLAGRTGTPVYDTTTIPGGHQQRGVAVSEEFIRTEASQGDTCFTASTGANGCVQYGAWVDGDTIKVANLTGGTIVVSDQEYDLPTGTFHSIRMDRTAQNLWVAMDTSISRFDIIDSTTEEPIGSGPSPPTGGDGDGDDIGQEINDFLASNTFLGIVLVIALAAVGIWLALAAKRRDVIPTAAAIGAAIGFAVAAFLGWFPPAVTFITVLLVIAVAWFNRGR